MTNEEISNFLEEILSEIKEGPDTIKQAQRIEALEIAKRKIDLLT